MKAESMTEEHLKQLLAEAVAQAAISGDGPCPQLSTKEE